MAQIRCYRTTRPSGDEIYTLEPPAHGPAEPLILDCVEDVRAARSASGEVLLYRGNGAYGQSVAAALRHGWCRKYQSDEEASLP